jgi:hypothetical protein
MNPNLIGKWRRKTGFSGKIGFISLKTTILALKLLFDPTFLSPS